MIIIFTASEETKRCSRCYSIWKGTSKEGASHCHRLLAMSSVLVERGIAPLKGRELIWFSLSKEQAYWFVRYELSQTIVCNKYISVLLLMVTLPLGL